MYAVDSTIYMCGSNSIGRETADSFKQHFIIRLEQLTMHFNSCTVKAQRTVVLLSFYREAHPFCIRGSQQIVCKRLFVFCADLR